MRRPGPLSPLGAATKTADASQRTGARLGLRSGLAGLIVLGLFALLLTRLWTIQVVQGSKLLKSAVATTTRVVDVAPPRGDILTRSGDVLAGDVLREVLTLDQTEAKAHPAVIGRLAALLGISAASIRAELDQAAKGLGQYNPYAPVPISLPGNAKVPAAAILAIDANHRDFPGVEITPTYERVYPHDALGAQVLGYVGDITAQELAHYKDDGYSAQDSFGQSGLEAQYELELHGTPGTATVEVDPSGAVVTQTSSSSPKQGDSLYLNMDLGLEQTLSSALSAQIAKLRGGLPGIGPVPADWGAAVVLDAQNGHVLALDSYPGYNNNEWVGGITPKDFDALLHAEGEPLNDYVIGGLQAPGSTFKLATATAALDDGLITPGFYFDDTGSYTIPGSNPPQVLHNSEGEVLGPVNVTTALSESSDVFFYNLGALFWYAWANHGTYGETPIQDVAHDYGLGSVSGIDLPGEAMGQVDSPQLRKSQHAANPSAFPSPAYYPADNVEMAFGQGETLVTPIQMADAYEAFANGGKVYQPQILAAITNSSGTPVRTLKPRVISTVHFAPGAYPAMLSGFEGAVQSPKGTAYGAFTGFDFTKWNIAGKTGTATPTANLNTQPTSWFVAFGGPRGRAPRYVVAVEIDQAGYGADAAAPVARRVFDYLAAHGLAPLRLKGA